jgi:hypothetical protein
MRTPHDPMRPMISSSLTPFYARARRRRLMRTLRWPLILAGSLLLILAALLAIGGFWF